MNARFPSSPQRRLAVVDGHVHVHAHYDPAVLFDAAHRNLLAQVSQGRITPPALYLLLAECAGTDFFQRLQAAERHVAGPWCIRSTAEETSVIVEQASRRLVIVAGRQVATAEGLEILLLGTRRPHPDGLPAREILQRTASQGMLRVIPWGVGKWWFDRGRHVRALIAEFRAPDLFVGDSGLRPWFWSQPALFAEAGRLGTRQLNGTDPLPFARDARRAGTSGFEVEIHWDEARPAAALITALTDPDTHPTSFRAPERTMRFMFNQLRMQLRRRARVHATP